MVATQMKNCDFLVGSAMKCRLRQDTTVTLEDCMYCDDHTTQLQDVCEEVDNGA